MGKAILIFCTLITTNLYSICREDSIFYYKLTPTKEIIARGINTYDNKNNKVSFLLQAYNSTTHSWINNVYNQFIYDQDNNEVLFISQNWNSTQNSWQNATQVTSIYNSTKKITEKTTEYWSANSWQNKSKSLYLYDSIIRLKEEGFYKWDTLGSIWLLDSKGKYEYNPNNYLSEVIWTDSLLNGSWVNNTLFVYSYDIDNNVTEWLFKKWDSVSSNWINDNRIKYQYNFGKIVESEQQYWIQSLLSWRGSNKHEFQYDANMNQTAEDSYIWDTPSNSYIKNYRTEYVCAQTNVAVMKDNSVGNYLLYPNPVLNRKANLVSETKSTAIIIDITGKEVYSQSILTGENVICFPDKIQSGVYFIKMENSVRPIVIY